MRVGVGSIKCCVKRVMGNGAGEGGAAVIFDGQPNTTSFLGGDTSFFCHTLSESNVVNSARSLSRQFFQV